MDSFGGMLNPIGKNVQNTLQKKMNFVMVYFVMVLLEKANGL